MAFKPFHTHLIDVMRCVQTLFLLSILFTFAGARVAEADTGDETVNIVGFGDSLMAGYLLDSGQGFPAQLEAALKARGHDVSVANAGVSGDTTSAGLSRLDWSIPDGTDLVILELGANDMLRGLDPAITEANLDKMITRLKERGIPVLLAGMYAAPNLGSEYQRKFDAIYPHLADKHDVPLVPFFLDGVATQSSLLLEDGMHPNAQGVDVMVEKMLPAVEALIETAKPRTEVQTEED